jgi:acetyl esterase/lipase
MALQEEAMTDRCSGRFVVITTVTIVLTLLAGCEKVEPTATPMPPTDTPPLPSPTPTAAPFEVTRDVPYITGGYPEQKLDIYLPTRGDRPFPTLLVIHGGERDKTDLAHWARHFVEQDYAVVSINYRDMPLFDYPARVQDAFCALAWTHANAGTYGFDPRRVVALGHSVGGTLTAMLGTVDNPDLFTEGCPHQLPEADWIQGAIPFTGVFDYVSAVRFSPERGSTLKDYFGGDLNQVPETWAEASAATWVDGSEPPFLLIHGMEDDTIELDQSVEFAEILDQAGVDVELLLIPDADHGAILNSEQSFEAVEDFLATLAVALANQPIKLWDGALPATPIFVASRAASPSSAQ